MKQELTVFQAAHAMALIRCDISGYRIDWVNGNPYFIGYKGVDIVISSKL